MSDVLPELPETGDPHELTSRYFDGELEGAEEQRALDHLASCARCQAELEDFMGLEVALRAAAPVVASRAASSAETRAVASETVAGAAGSVAKETPVISIEQARARRRRTIFGASLVAAAALAALVLRKPAATESPALALAETRGLEVRFSAPLFAAHRPYSVVRGGGTRETFSLTALAELERRRDAALLAAAQAASGELVRAKELLAALPPSPERDSDLAALELAGGRPEPALEAADRALARAPKLASALWNRGLALRELGLPAGAAMMFEAVAALAEPGWAAEAAEKAASTRSMVAQRGPQARAFAEAGRAMIDRSGPPLTEADAAARPGLTRLYFHDALRSATTRDEALALAPLAAALDRAVGNSLATRAVERVAAADFAARAPLAKAYRELALGRAANGGQALLAQVSRRRGFEDLHLGTLVLARQTQVNLPALERLITATEDPWFLLYLPLEQATAREAAGAADLAESGLRTALAGCDQRLWAHRCAHLAWRLTTLYLSQGRYVEAEQHAERAAAVFGASGAPELEDAALGRLAEVRRGLGRLPLAAATFQEVRARLGEQDCRASRFAAAGEALISAYRDAAPGPLAAVDACGEPPSRFEVALTVDLARMRQTPEDVDRAQRWIAAARGAGTPELAQFAELAAARLEAAQDAGVVARLRAALAKLDGEHEETRAFRAWVMQTLVERAGASGAWSEALALIAEELGVAPPARCAVGVGLDDTRGTVVVLGADGQPRGETPRVEAPPRWQGQVLVTPALLAHLAGCAQVAVLARPPLHGRADLLPPELPWAFVGRRSAAPGAVAPVGGARALYVGEVLPPAALALPALAPLRVPAEGQVLRGPEATPAAVLSALGEATYAELHVHGEVDLSVADASFLALSPGVDQRWALTAALVRKAKLPSAPVVVLAACRAAVVAPYEHRRWSLPDAFLEAGARAVIAPTVEIPDDEAAAFFAELRTELAAGKAPAAALAALRAAYVARGATWAASVILFE